MDVGELLSFQPDKPSLSNEPKQKRVRGEEEDDFERKRKRRYTAGGLQDTLSSGQMTEEEKEKIRQMVEAEPDAELMDETSFKKMLLQFEKRVYKNQENRIKFPDLPEKFLESEIELNEIIHEMHVMATVPEYYQILVDLRCVQSLLQLVAHENTDISIAVIDLLQELTDPDILNENEDTASVLVDALLDGQVVAVLVNNLDRLDENVKEEFEGVHNSLAIVENMTEFKPDVCSDLAQQGLMQWLLKRLRMKRPFDQNKLYCSEIMSILLQDTEENRGLLGELEGIDILLQQLATFKKHDPATKDEMELMENLFNSMCSALAYAANRSRFLRGEGLQLMNLMLREKKLSRNSAIKVLNHAMTGLEGQDNCQKFVEILGLRSVFPLYMKTPKTAKTGPSSDELEEHICSIIGSMLRNCQGVLRQRLLLKFTENDHEKVERLLELHFKYLDKVRQCDDQIEQEKMRLKHSGEDVDEDMEDEFYMKRLDAGLFTLQLIDYIMLESCATGAPSIRARVMQILNMRGGSIKVIRGIMREYAGNIGDARDKVAREAEQDRILALVDKF